MNRIDPKHLARFDDDFALWSAEQAALLRAARFDQVDIQNVAEEIESLGRSDKYEIDSRMEVLLAHLLKWQFQPQKRSNSWKASIVEQRQRIARRIKDSPTLKDYPAESLAGSYVIARHDAIRETGLAEGAIPESSPYSAAQALDLQFWPDGN